MTSTKKPQLPLDIEELHKQMCDEGKMTYEDPATGYTVMTELYLKKKARNSAANCCGNACRHCPFDWINVGPPKKSVDEDDDDEGTSPGSSPKASSPTVGNGTDSSPILKSTAAGGKDILDDDDGNEGPSSSHGQSPGTALSSKDRCAMMAVTPLFLSSAAFQPYTTSPLYTWRTPARTAGLLGNPPLVDKQTAIITRGILNIFFDFAPSWRGSISSAFSLSTSRAASSLKLLMLGGASIMAWRS